MTRLRTALIVLVLAGLAQNAHAAAEPAPVDYVAGEFTVQRVLDRGDRPVWSPDGNRLVFTDSDTIDGPAYELDLATGQVTCLTCAWGPRGLVFRVYYLPDGSFLIAGRPDLESSTDSQVRTEADFLLTELYWMPASAAAPPQPLDVIAPGEVAISPNPTSNGGFLIAWGPSPRDPTVRGLSVGEVVHDGTRASLTKRREYPIGGLGPDDPPAYSEPYDFAENDGVVTYFSFTTPAPPLDGEVYPVNGEMYALDLDTGASRLLYEAPHWNETHLFPDERFGLEEEVGTGIFVVDVESGERRPLAEGANQSLPARDGRRIAFVMDGGLYVGEFH